MFSTQRCIRLDRSIGRAAASTGRSSCTDSLCAWTEILGIAFGTRASHTTSILVYVFSSLGTPDPLCLPCHHPSSILLPLTEPNGYRDSSSIVDLEENVVELMCLLYGLCNPISHSHIPSCTIHSSTHSRFPLYEGPRLRARCRILSLFNTISTIRLAP
ncbi:hypothetical protein BT96DRAFT_416761 [Gymnopus androsaceus JB14]|uniref:Uncharacterized protein n=1 Tax=Gymnopus androsaceus JB14 TaxID=1447944 RepID=A0A6A4GSX8_9AGAR|nr:hypothetical protein BT96DRAFT_416761 [Gymnopus androsaceus JB14]